ncbi:hypothetical protein ACLKA6_001450 [Drosophila palustris]
MEPNIAININVNANPVSTETLDFQRIVDDLIKEFEEMKAERGRERAELDALRQLVAELNSRVATLEAAREREAEEGGERGTMAAREGLAEEEGERAVEEARVEGSLPDRPFTDLNDFLQFERSLETDAALQNVLIWEELTSLRKEVKEGAKLQNSKMMVKMTQNIYHFQPKRPWKSLRKQSRRMKRNFINLKNS